MLREIAGIMQFGVSLFGMAMHPRQQEKHFSKSRRLCKNLFIARTI
jgi:hypothetical protein